VRSDPIVLAIPFFFLLMGVELLVSRWQGGRYYRLSDSISDLSCGVLQQLTLVFARTALFAAYLTVYDRLRLFSVPGSSPAAWIVCFLGVDLCYYWFHRKSHETNALWAAHVVHHQSEEYNLSVALRQSSLQAAFSWVFYLPLALLGFPPVMFATLAAVNTLYQFWIHTRAIGRLGPLEWVLNTPSHHRVHHARNPEYIDRNHGGTLIVWDRLFGTFRREEQEPVYGITRPLASWNPLWANVHYWCELRDKLRRIRRVSDRLRLLVARPGWMPEDAGGFQPAPAVRRATHRPWHVETPVGLSAYVLVQFALTLGFTVAFLHGQAGMASVERILYAASIAAALVSLCGLLERKPWAFGLEVVRLVFGATLLGATLWSSLAQRWLVGAAAAGCVVWLLSRQREWARVPLAADAT
jgi:sterol desaturase/sphingolipid hydroxylase (fatty acid hydroxylase superfamily)